MSRGRDPRSAIAIVYVTAMFMSVLDTTIVTIALPAISRDFHVTSAEVASVTVAYLVALTVCIPVSGWLGDAIGPRRALLGAIAVFTLGSALCSVSPSFGALIVFSALQGIGGAVMLPVGLAMLFRAYPPPERVRLAASLALVAAIGPALGPILGGALVTVASWRLVFLVNVPVGLAIVAWGARRLPERSTPHPGRLDVAGFALSAVGLGLLVTGLSETSIRGWRDPLALGAIAIGVAALIGLVALERRTDHPLIELRLFRDRLFTAATSLYALGSVAYIGALYLVAVFLQDALGCSALEAGLTSAASAVGVIVGGQLVARIVHPKAGPRRTMLGGLLMIAVSTGLMALVQRDTDPWLIRVDLLALGIGVAAVFVPAQAISMIGIPAADTARATPIFNAGKQLGSALGVALLAGIVALGTSARTGATAPTAPYHVAFLAAAAIALGSTAVASRVRDQDAAALTRRPRH